MPEWETIVCSGSTSAWTHFVTTLEYVLRKD